MKDIIKIISIKKAAALLAVLAVFGVTGEPISDGNEAKPAAKEESILLGPFTLAELCEKGGRLAKELARGGGPTEAEILKALSGCKLYFLDKKTLDKGKWRFVERNGCPTVVLEGPFRYELKDKAGKDLTIQVLKSNASADLTDYTQTPPTRRGTIGVWLRVEGPWGIFFRTATYGTSAHLHYNIIGDTKGLRKYLPK